MAEPWEIPVVIRDGEIMASLIFAAGCMAIILMPNFCFRDPLARYRNRGGPASKLRRAALEEELDRAQARREAAQRARAAGKGAAQEVEEDEEEDEEEELEILMRATRQGPYARVPQAEPPAATTAPAATQRRPAAAVAKGGYTRLQEED